MNDEGDDPKRNARVGVHAEDLEDGKTPGVFETLFSSRGSTYRTLGSLHA